MSALGKQLAQLARQAAGSFKTVSDRMKIAERFAGHLRDGLNIQIRTVDQIKSRHIEAYIQHRQAAGMTLRTLQNEMAGIRGILRAGGREKLADSERLSNNALGLAGAPREGTKAPIPDERYRAAVEAAMGRDKGMAACLQLSRTLGLRAEEAVQSVKSLATWQKQIEAGNNSVTVVFGTKGGRPRETTLHDRQAVAVAVRFALDVAKDNSGKLIDRPDLKTAMDRFHNEARALGLTGKEAPHSLRYAYACDAVRAYQEQGYSTREALALASADLGHGDGRGHYIAHVYTKEG